ncbi:IS30 family transposase [Enterococcus avium]|uniref:IS30 family transposase n=1 Tax=Enterococcus avium TaxID=33945 RepID=UPI00232B1EF9|nr:IS30 family transposase [Enterococcus avium]MDB1749254.1 IS30 family transposase [Enterococcus avium]MDB1753432.1 IS30 family transposase [Enterococcus avium]MDB1760498.1 IS30 family transposase [Enterococcus avium]
MTYTHLTTDELVMIASYFKTNESVANVSQILGRSRQTIYNDYHFLEDGHSVLDYYQRYKQNKSRCGRPAIVLSAEQSDYVQNKVAQGWTPDVIIGRAEHPIACSVRTLYRMFEKGLFDPLSLPLKGKCKPNGHQEKRGKQAFRRSIHQRKNEYANYSNEFGHLEGDTIIGAKHKSAVITLVERLTKVIITLKPAGRQAKDIEHRMNQWFQTFPRHMFKSITFDCGKEFLKWKAISNVNDIDIYFADPGTPSQRGLNEHSNGLLRKDGLNKTMDFTNVSESFIQSVASRRNHVPRKSLNYRTPLEVFLSYMNEGNLSSLI